MQYRKQAIDIDTFIRYIKEGRSFCYCFDDMDEVFGNSVKTQDNFRYTNVIAIDIDDSSVPMTEYANTLHYKPTIAYTTYSNKVKGYRFRMVYVFTEKIVGLNNYVSAYNGILCANGMKIKDNCMQSANQLFIGNGSKDVEVITNGTLYLLSEFAITNKMWEGCCYINSKCKAIVPKVTAKKSNLPLNPTFTQDLSNMRPSDFISHYSMQYPYFDSTNLILSEDYSHFIFPDDYREISRKWELKDVITKRGERKTVRAVHKTKDGEKRRKKLFDTGIILKAIKPDITIEHLVYILCVERYHYYDNSDKQLTNQVLIDIAQCVMKADYKPRLSEHGQFKVNKPYWAEKGYNAKSAARKVSKMLNYQSIGEWYDCSKPVRENAQYAKEHGIKKAKLRTLYAWCKENGVSYKGAN